MGAIIYYFKIPPFIVTLSGMFLARGGAYVLTTDSISIKHPFYTEVSKLVYIFPDKGRFTFAAGCFSGGGGAGHLPGTFHPLWAQCLRHRRE